MDRDLVARARCGARFYVDDVRHPLTYAEREATSYGPPTLVIVGGDRLVHRCVITEGIEE
jgi:hypothetical protein